MNMNSRPVLSMSFYNHDETNRYKFNMPGPYQQMRIFAELQKQQYKRRVQQKKIQSERAMNNINSLVENFFPEDKVQEQKLQKKKINKQSKQRSDKNANNNQQLKNKKIPKYSPEYFESLDKNLKDINMLLDRLDTQN